MSKQKECCLELPCPIGTIIYRLKYERVPDDEYRMSFHEEWTISQGKFTLQDVNAVGKTVFLRRDDAVKVREEKEEK